ncbi:MAG: hypothetical protein GY801_45070 [bacterium]|nr:hypothetical protein [bacterium]
MNVRTQTSVLIVVCCVLIYSTAFTAFGQLTVAPPPVPKQEDTLSLREKMTIATLRGIIQSIEAVEEELQEAQAAFDAAETEEQKAAFAEGIKGLLVQRTQLQQDFEEIATGLDLEKFVAPPQDSFDWKAEMQEVVGPIVEEIKNLTARPRELEKLRTQVSYYEKRLGMVKKAIAQIQTRIDQSKAKKMKRLLGEVKVRWEDREKELSRLLSVTQYQLEEMQSAQESVLTSLEEGFKGFFRSRGRNLFLAFVAFMAIFIGMRVLYRLLVKALHLNQADKRPFFLRLVELLYHLLTLFSTALAFLIVLYMSGDWVLFGMTVIFLLGLAWTAKQALLTSWEQIKLFLNLGTVREGERVMYHGLPWHVRSLNIYTKLHNPALKGGFIRIPLRDLVGLESRPFYKDEPWFPCQEGDLVILADEGIGTVLMQTPERVILDTKGGCRKTYPTLAFLDQNPINYSINTFGVFATFGIDYQHQSIITRDIPEKLKAFLEEELAKEEFGQDLITLLVQFKETGASSLDLLIFTSWPGAHAKNYFAITRLLQRMTVDACNAYGWVIPFNQITVHHAAPSSQELVG